MTLKSDAKFEEKLISCFKNDKNLVNFDLSTRNSQNFLLDWFLLCKGCNFWPEKVQRSYLSWHLRVMQNLKKNWFRCGKWHEDYGKFSPGHLKVSKLRPWCDPFIRSRKYMSLTFTEELCVITMKNDAHLKRNWLVVSKLQWGIWWILARALESLKNLHCNGLLSNKGYYFWAKKVQKSYVWWHWRLIQNLKENWLLLSEMTWGI